MHTNGFRSETPQNEDSQDNAGTEEHEVTHDFILFSV